MKNLGFTLLELIIVIALIMILSAIGIGGYTSATAKSLDTQRKNDLNQIAKALEEFYADTGRYPGSSGGKMLCYSVTNTITNGRRVSTSSEEPCVAKLTFKQDGKSTIYLTIPTDPDKTQKYVYYSTGSGFELYAAIQNDDDRDLIKSGNSFVTYFDAGKGINCGAIACNYKLTETGLVKDIE